MLDRSKKRWAFQFNDRELKNNIEGVKLTPYSMFIPYFCCEVNYLIQSEDKFLCDGCPYSFEDNTWCMRRGYTLYSRLK